MIRFSFLLLAAALFLSCELPIEVPTQVSKSAPIVTPEPTPTPNLAFTLVPGVGQATAQWNAVPGAETYRIVWTTDSSGILGGSLETAATTALVDRLAPGVDYQMTVTALAQGLPLAEGKAVWTSAGWTWDSDVTNHTAAVSSDAQSYDLGDGNALIVLTERTITWDLFGRLTYTTAGFSRTNWLRTTTTPPKAGEPEVVEKLVQTVAAAWVDPWTSFTAPDEETATFSADRKTFTLASSPGVEWHWVP